MATVLLVDDDPKIRELLRLYVEYVERDGHRTFTAADGETAVATALRSRPDLVVLDVIDVPYDCRLVEAATAPTDVPRIDVASMPQMTTPRISRCILLLQLDGKCERKQHRSALQRSCDECLT